jgi:hypothetical protein
VTWSFLRADGDFSVEEAADGITNVIYRGMAVDCDLLAASSDPSWRGSKRPSNGSSERADHYRRCRAGSRKASTSRSCGEPLMAVLPTYDDDLVRDLLAAPVDGERTVERRAAEPARGLA